MKHGILFLFTLLAALQVAWGGVTGKIVGRVTDEAGEPLPGVNVTVPGQPFGAASDLEGEYQILHLPPGLYEVQFSSLGFSTLVVEGVSVSVDLSTRQDAQMESSAIAGETITIVAERPLVQADRTYSASYVDSRTLQTLPVTELSQVVEIQAGVVDGHFRGGRSGEVLYLVDGIPVTDVYDGSRGVDVQVSMVQELQVLSGTFNAEHGQAMSGVVNTVTRDAGESLSLSLSGWIGDYISDHDEQFPNIGAVDAMALSNIELGFSSPTPFDWLSVNGSLRYSDNKGWRDAQRLFSPQEQVGAFVFDGTEVRVFNAAELLGWVDAELGGERRLFFIDSFTDSLWTTDVLLQGHWPMEDAADSAAVFDWIERGEARSAELFERSSLDSGKAEWVTMDTEIRRAAQLKLRAQLGPGSVLRLMLLGNDRDYREASHSYRFTPDGRLFRYSRSQLTSLKWDAAIDRETAFDISVSHSLNSYRHRLYDDIRDPRYVSDEWNAAESGFYYYRLGGVDPLNPAGPEDLYIGFAQMGGTENEHFQRRTDSWNLKTNLTRQWGKRHLWKAGLDLRLHRLYYNRQVVSFNGFEIVDPEGANNDVYTRHPWEGAAYIQDKIEFSDVTVNAGLRLDVFNSNATLPADLRRPNEGPTVDAGTKIQLSPRLAIAYLVTESGVLHFSYGHFFQRPSFEVLYRNPDFEITGPYTIVGNPDLNVERTVQYEIGLQQALSEDISMDLSFYARDIRDLVSTDRQIETATVDKYFIFTNRDFGTVKGLVLSLDKRYDAGFNAGLDYTFQVARANASSAEAARSAAEAGNEVNKYLIPLNWDRRHTINGHLAYDHKGRWGLSLLGTYGSGLPYTPVPRSDELVVGLLENSGRKPVYINFDLSGHWNLLAQPQLAISFQVRNLFDRLNENNVFARTGRAGYDIDWQDTQSELVVDPGNWSRPREVIVGFRLSI
jgi:hypothetical protein